MALKITFNKICISSVLVIIINIGLSLYLHRQGKRLSFTMKNKDLPFFINENKKELEKLFNYEPKNATKAGNFLLWKNPQEIDGVTYVRKAEDLLIHCPAKKLSSVVNYVEYMKKINESKNGLADLFEQIHNALEDGFLTLRYCKVILKDDKGYVYVDSGANYTFSHPGNDSVYKILCI